MAASKATAGMRQFEAELDTATEAKQRVDLELADMLLKEKQYDERLFAASLKQQAGGLNAGRGLGSKRHLGGGSRARGSSANVTARGSTAVVAGGAKASSVALAPPGDRRRTRLREVSGAGESAASSTINMAK